jgi:endogenous inhibitor of DNA gyrase (YacG/DUF329 family)
MNAKERDEHEIACPRCGQEAEWSFADDAKRQIEIMCPDCGRYVMPREEFDLLAADDAQLNEPAWDEPGGPEKS